MDQVQDKSSQSDVVHVTNQQLEREIAILTCLGETKIQSVVKQIEDLRILKTHDLAAMESRFSDNLAAIELRFKDNKEALQAALVAVTDANSHTATAIEKRFEDVNEFRSQLKDQAATFITRAELTLVNNNIAGVTERVAGSVGGITDRFDIRIKAIEQSNANMSGRLWAFGVVFTFINIVVTWYLAMGHRVVTP